MKAAVWSCGGMAATAWRSAGRRGLALGRVSARRQLPAAAAAGFSGFSGPAGPMWRVGSAGRSGLVDLDGLRGTQADGLDSASRRACSTGVDSSEIKDLSLRYSDGVCRLVVPIPRHGVDEELEFRFAPMETVEVVLGRISDAVKDGANALPDATVDIRDRLGHEVDLQDSVSRLCAEGFQLLLTGVVFNVASPPYFGGAYGLSETDGAVDLRSLIQKSMFMRVHKILTADTRRTMHVDEYLKLCSENGIPLVEALQLLAALHQVGVILHFEKSAHEEVRQTIFLKPEEVTDSVFTEFGMQSPTARFVEEQAAIKRAELEQLESVFNQMHVLKTSLDDRADYLGQRFSWLGLGALSGGVGLFWWLSYEKFSWDIMEPITYFASAAGGIFAFAYWKVTAADFEYENMRSLVVQQTTRRLYRVQKFDEELYNEYKQRVDRCKDELRTLDVTGYNPALISAYLSRSDRLSSSEESN